MVAVLAAGLALAPTPAWADPAADDTRVSAPAKALQYHRVLLRKPAPGYLFDRFYSAWLEEASAAEMKRFLEERAGDPGQLADRLLLGCFLAKQGDTDAAIEQFARGLKQDPTNAAVWLRKAELEALRPDLAQALADLDSADRAGPGPALQLKIAKLRAQLLLKSGKREQALETLTKLVATNPTDETVAEDVIDLQASEGLYAEAIGVTRGLISRTKDPYRRMLRRLRLADLQRQAGRRDQALDTLTTALNEIGAGDWLEAEVLARIEKFYRTADDAVGLTDRYAALVESFPRRIAVRKGYARALADSGKSDEAIAQFREVLRLTPGDRDNQEAFVQLLEQTGDLAGARDQLQRLIDLNPKDGELLVRLAKLSKRLDDRAGAVAAVGGYFDLSDRGEFAYLRAARLLEQMRYFDEATKRYAALTAAFPNSDGAKEARAAYLYDRGEKDEAIALWKRAAAGDDPEGAVRVARALSARQENRAAYELLSARVEQFQNNGLLLGLLIDEALELGEVDDAVGLCLRRVDLAESVSEFRDAIRQASRVLERSGRVAATLATLRQKKPTPQRSCLIAELLALSGDAVSGDKVLAPLIAAGDARAISQQVRLAEARRDLFVALNAAKKLYELPGGRNAANLKLLLGLSERTFRFDEAARWAAEWRRIAPDNADPWLAEADLLINAGEVTKAIATLRRATRTLSSPDRVQARLAEAFLNAGKPDEAEALYWARYDAAQDREARRLAIEALALAAKKTGRMGKLMDALRRRQRANPRAAAPLEALATVAGIAGDNRRRIEALAEARRLRPADPQLLNQVADLQIQQGQLLAAQQTLRKAAPLDETDQAERLLEEVANRLAARAAKPAPPLPPRVDQRIALKYQSDWPRIAANAERLVATKPDDYRLRFRWAVALEETGELDAAAEQFFKVINAATPESLSGNNDTVAELIGRFDPSDEIGPPEMIDVFAYKELTSRAYRYRSQVLKTNYNLRRTPELDLAAPPESPAELRECAAIHLADIAGRLPEPHQQRLRTRIAGLGVRFAKYASVTALGGAGQAQVAQMLERAPSDPGLLATLFVEPPPGFMDSVFRGRPVRSVVASEAECRRAFAMFAEDYPQLALTVAMRGLNRYPGLADLVPEVEQLRERLGKPMPKFFRPAFFEPPPRPLAGFVADWLLRWYPELRGDQDYRRGVLPTTLKAASGAPNPGALVRLANYESAETALPAPADPAAYQGGRGFFGYRPLGADAEGAQGAALITKPPFPPAALRGLPPLLLDKFRGGQPARLLDFQSPRRVLLQWSREQVEAVLPAAKSPLLKVLLAARLGDGRRVEALLEGLTSGPTRSLDAYLLAAGWECKQGRTGRAIELIEQGRSAPMPATMRPVLDGYLVALSAERADLKLASEAELAIGRDAARRLSLISTKWANQRLVANALADLGLDQDAKRLRGAVTRSVVGGLATGSNPMLSSGQGAKARAAQLMRLGAGEEAAKLALASLKGYVNKLPEQPSSWQALTAETEAIGAFGRFRMNDALLAAFAPGDSEDPARHARYAWLLAGFGRLRPAGEAFNRAAELGPLPGGYQLRRIDVALRRGNVDAAKAIVASLDAKTAAALPAFIFGAAERGSNGAMYDSEEQWGALAPMLVARCREVAGDPTWATKLRAYWGKNDYKRTNHGREWRIRNRLHGDLCRAMLEVPGLAEDAFVGLLASHDASPELGRKDFRQLAYDVLLPIGEGGHRQPPPPSIGARPIDFVTGLGRNLTLRSPAAYLIDEAWRLNDYAELDASVMPRLREQRPVLAKLMDAYRRLYQCDPDDFAAATDAYISLAGGARRDAASAIYQEVLRVYDRRALTIDLQPLLLAYLTEQAAGSGAGGVGQLIGSYAGAVAKHRDTRAAADWLKAAFAVYAGPLEGRAARITSLYNAKSGGRPGSPNARLRQVASIIEYLASDLSATRPLLEALDEEELHLQLGMRLKSKLYFGTFGALNIYSNPAGAIKWLDQSGMLGGLDDMRLAWTPVEDGACFGGVVAKRLTGARYRAPKFVTRLTNRQPTTLGAAMVLAWLKRDAETAEAVLAALASDPNRSDEFTPRQRAALQELLPPMLERAGLNKAVLVLPAGKPAPGPLFAGGGADFLPEVRRAVRAAGLSLPTVVRLTPSAILQAERLEALQAPAEELRLWVLSKAASLASADPDRAAALLVRFADLCTDAAERGAIGDDFAAEALKPDPIGRLVRGVVQQVDESKRQTLETYLLLAIARLGDGDHRPLSRDELSRLVTTPGLNAAVSAWRSAEPDASPAAAAKGVMQALRERFGPGASPLLTPVYAGFSGRLSESDLQRLIDGLGVLESDDPAAQDMLAAAQFALADRPSSGGDAGRLTAAANTRWAAVLTDPAQPLANRVVMAGCLLSLSETGLRPTARRAIARLSAAASECGIAVSPETRSMLAWNTLRLVRSSPDDPAGGAHRRAWVERSASDAAAATASRDEIIRMAAACYEAGDRGVGRRVLSRFAERLRGSNQVLGLLVREGELDQAVDYVTLCWQRMKPLPGSARVVCYDEEVAENVPRLLRRMPNRGLAYVAQLLLAGLPDAGDAPAAGRRSRRSRLSAVADSFDSSLFAGPEQVTQTLLLFEGSGVERRIAAPLTKAAGAIDLIPYIRKTFGSYESVVPLKQFHGRVAAAGGDFEPLLLTIEALFEIRAANNGSQSLRARRWLKSTGELFADAVIRHGSKLEEGQPGELAERIRPILDRYPDRWDIEGGQLAAAYGVLCVRAGQRRAFYAWCRDCDAVPWHQTVRGGRTRAAATMKAAAVGRADPSTLADRIGVVTASLAMHKLMESTPSYRARRLKPRDGEQLPPLASIFTPAELPAVAKALAEAGLSQYATGIPQPMAPKAGSAPPTGDAATRPRADRPVMGAAANRRAA